MTTSTRDDDNDRPETLQEHIERLRRTPPRPGTPPHQTIREITEAQGTKPIDAEWLRANSPGPLYEGFEEDIRRMRRGLPALGPRK